MSMIDDILERFGVPRPRLAAAPPPDTYQIGGGWGDAIRWQPGTKRQRVMGWKQRNPQIGDLLHADMKSGRVGIYRFTAVRRAGDPPDMFFGDVELVGYEGSD